MKKEQIKKECELIYENIKLAEERLYKLRDICSHEDTYEGNCSYRIGATFPATMCSICGDVVKFDITP